MHLVTSGRRRLAIGDHGIGSAGAPITTRYVKLFFCCCYVISYPDPHVTCTVMTLFVHVKRRRH